MLPTRQAIQTAKSELVLPSGGGKISKVIFWDYPAFFWNINSLIMGGGHKEQVVGDRLLHEYIKNPVGIIKFSESVFLGTTDY